jgi:hypothetical protein
MELSGMEWIEPVSSISSAEVIFGPVSIAVGAGVEKSVEVNVWVSEGNGLLVFNGMDVAVAEFICSEQETIKKARKTMIDRKFFGSIIKTLKWTGL